MDLYADGVIASKAELGEKLAALDEETEAVEAAKAAARDRSVNIEKWKEQKRSVLFMYAAFAAGAPAEFTSGQRRAMYERIGLRVTAYKSGPPEIEVTLDPNALPSVGEASEVLEKLQETASNEALDAVRARIMRPYADTVLDEESGEWVRVEDPERLAELAIDREAEREYEDAVPEESTSQMLIQNCFPIPTCKNTPRGGRSIAMMMRSRSIRKPLSLFCVRYVLRCG